MNYLKSMDYIEGKDKLEGEFKEAFLNIEGYYIQAYTEDRYEIQLSLKQILNDFLTAQESDSSLTTIAGSDIKDYAFNIIKEVNKTKKDPLYWVTTVICFAWLILFVMLSQALLFDGYKGYAFIEKMRNIYFSVYLARDFLIYIVIAYLLNYFRKWITKRLFYQSSKIKIIHFIYIFIIALLATYYITLSSPYDNAFGFHMPLSLFSVLALVATTYIIVVGFISYRKTKAKKQALMEYEDTNIAQIACPSCGHVHDIDYPKCPKCGFHNE